MGSGTPHVPLKAHVPYIPILSGAYFHIAKTVQVIYQEVVVDSFFKSTWLENTVKGAL